MESFPSGKLSERWKNSVLQLRVTTAVDNVFRPYYSNPKDEKEYGTGFIIDINKGFVITNAHVVSSAVYISGRCNKLGEQDLALKVVSVCLDKDTALCQLDEESISYITNGMDNPEDLNFSFGDSLDVKVGDKVMTLGYPLGQKNIKITEGIISGFQDSLEENLEIPTNDIPFEERMSYIQITAAINPGNSGGPLLNYKGQVIAMTTSGIEGAQNIGYSISSRIILSIYEMLSFHPVEGPHLIINPKVSLEYNQINLDLLESISAPNDLSSGVYVKSIYPDSCFPDIMRGDIICNISFEDPFILVEDSISVAGDFSSLISSSPKVSITAVIDNYNNVILEGIPRGKEISRNLTIKEFLELIPVGSAINCTIFRSLNMIHVKCDKKMTNRESRYESNNRSRYESNNRSRYESNNRSRYESNNRSNHGLNYESRYESDLDSVCSKGQCYPPSNRVQKEYILFESFFKSSKIFVRSISVPQIVPLKYEIFSGICVSELSLNHIIKDFPHLYQYKIGIERYRPIVIINQVFPSSTVEKLGIFDEGDLVESVDGSCVRTLDDIKKVLISNKSDKYLTVTTTNNNKLVILRDRARQEDKEIFRRFNIDKYVPIL